MEGLVLKSGRLVKNDRTVEAPRGGAGIEIALRTWYVYGLMKPLVEGLVLKLLKLPHIFLDC